MYGSICNFHLHDHTFKFLLVGHLNRKNRLSLFSGTLQYFMGMNEIGIKINSR